MNLLKSSGEIFCFQNDLPLFFTQILCSKANLEFSFFSYLPKCIVGKEGIDRELDEFPYFETVFSYSRHTLK